MIASHGHFCVRLESPGYFLHHDNHFKQGFSRVEETVFESGRNDDGRPLFKLGFLASGFYESSPLCHIEKELFSIMFYGLCVTTGLKDPPFVGFQVL